MTNESINLLIQNFLLDEERPASEITDALAHVSANREELGQAVYAAMLKLHMARLQGAQATLVMQQPRNGSIH